MEIQLSGNLYVCFIKSVFENNKKIGIEFIIDSKKSNNMLISGLNRLNILNNNRFFVHIKNYTDINLDLYATKYKSDISLLVLQENNINVIKINAFTITEKDKIIPITKQINKGVYINKYSMGKSNTVREILKIIKT